MTLEADLERFVLGETGERPHSDVGLPAQLSVARLLHVPSTGPVTRLAIDRVAHEAGVVAKSGRVEADLDLTAVALLASGEPLVRAEHSNRRPIAAIGERNVGRDRNPPLIRSSSAIAEPQVLLADEFERQEPEGPVGEVCEEPLSTASDHVPAPNHPGYIERDRLLRLRFHNEAEPAVRGDRWDHHRIRELDRSAVEWRDDGTQARRAAGRPVCRSTPRSVLSGMTVATRFGSQEIGARRQCIRGYGGSGGREINGARTHPSGESHSTGDSEQHAGGDGERPGRWHSYGIRWSRDQPGPSHSHSPRRYLTSPRISVRVNVYPNPGMRLLMFMMYPPAWIVSYRESSGRVDM